MKTLTLFRFPDPNVYHQSSKWFLGWGIVFLIIGTLAITLAIFTTMVSVMLLGLIFTLTGAVTLFDTLSVWRRSNGIYVPLLMSLIYLALGLMLLFGPMVSAITLTLLLAIFFIVVGLFRLILAVTFQLPGWGFGAFSGIIALLLGTMIMMQWPQSGLYIIGLFIGIDFLLYGWSYIMYAFMARNLK